MLFTSVSFLWFFLPTVILFNFILKNKYKNYFLFFASCAFYAWGEPRHLLIMLFSIVVNYLFGMAIAHFKNKKLWLALGIVSNVAILGYFKYFNLLLDTLANGFDLDVNSIYYVALPIGISFYTFQELSYLIDLYRGKFKVQKNIMKLGLYVSLFPQLIAGPIVQYADVVHDIDARTTSLQDLAYGIKRFIYGLSKKMIFSNTFALVTDSIFAYDVEHISVMAGWLGVISYALQIYYDFSGYSDMAIGLGKILGFTFLENFNYPYISSSVTEFWRRWHISLSSWFRDYVYIPLGGNKKGEYKTIVNIMIVFALTGFWHGAAYQFMFWGIYYGIIRVFEMKLFKKQNATGIKKVALHFYTIIVVLIGWVIFRSPDINYALSYIVNLFSFFDTTQVACTFARFMDMRTIVMLILAVLLSGPVQLMFPKLKKQLFDKQNVNGFEVLLLVVLFLYCIVLIVGNTYSPFIYFRF